MMSCLCITSRNFLLCIILYNTNLKYILTAMYIDYNSRCYVTVVSRTRDGTASLLRMTRIKMPKFGGLFVEQSVHTHILNVEDFFRGI